MCQSKCFVCTDSFSLPMNLRWVLPLPSFCISPVAASNNYGRVHHWHGNYKGPWFYWLWDWCSLDHTDSDINSKNLMQIYLGLHNLPYEGELPWEGRLLLDASAFCLPLKLNHTSPLPSRDRRGLTITGRGLMTLSLSVYIYRSRKEFQHNLRIFFKRCLSFHQSALMP